MNNFPIWFKYALIYFVLSFLIGLLGIYIGSIPFSIQFLLGVGILILLCRMMFKEIREANGSEFLSYGKAFLPIFLMVTVGSAFSVLANATWINFIDTSAKELVIEQQMEAAKSMATTFGASEEEAAEIIDSQEESMASKVEFVPMLINIVFMPIIGAILACIFAFFFRKEEKFGPY